MEKQTEVSTGGYDYQFVETPPDMLICKICHFPSREPCLSGCCGHTFCQSCIDYAKNVAAFYPWLCPVCRHKDFSLFPNKQNERIIKSLHVFCSNKERGCEWQGEINNISDHLKNSVGCLFEEVACSNNCENFMQRKFLNGHLVNECPRRKVDCQYCNITDELRYIEGSHMEKCPKYPLSCPNGCGISDIPREGMGDHRRECPLEEVDCPNECGVSFQQKYLQNHTKNECLRRKVNCQYCHITDELRYIEGSHMEKCLKFPLPCPNDCEISDVPREGMDDHREVCPLEEVDCPNECGVSFQRKCLQNHTENECPCRKVDCKYCHILDELQYIEGSHMKNCPKYPLPCPNDCGISDIPREGMDDHREMCPLEEVECSNQCRVFIQRRYLQSHIENECPCREINCQHCQTLGEQQFIEGEHVELCPKYPLACPNRCETKNILREDMLTHKKECPLEIVQCKYCSVGCNAMMARKDLGKHNQEKMEEHLSFTTSELVNTRDKLAATKQCLLSTEQQLAFTAKRLGDNEQQLESAEERLNDYEQQLAFTKKRLNDNARRLSVNERQLDVAKQQLASRTDEAMVKLQRKIEEIEHHSQLKLEMNLQQTMEQMQWALHLNSRVSNDDDQIFPAIIKLSEFERKKDDEMYWYSDTFYTHVDGYNLKLKVFPNGHDVGEYAYLSVYLYMEEGDDDDVLRWPMKKTLKVKLLNQISDTQHHSEMHSITAKRSRTRDDRWIWYAHNFISHNDLYYPPAGCKFLVNDSLFFEVSGY